MFYTPDALSAVAVTRDSFQVSTDDGTDMHSCLPLSGDATERQGVTERCHAGSEVC